MPGGSRRLRSQQAGGYDRLRREDGRCLAGWFAYRQPIRFADKSPGSGNKVVDRESTPSRTSRGSKQPFVELANVLGPLEAAKQRDCLVIESQIVTGGMRWTIEWLPRDRYFQHKLPTGQTVIKWLC